MGPSYWESTMEYASDYLSASQKQYYENMWEALDDVNLRFSHFVKPSTSDSEFGQRCESDETPVDDLDIEGCFELALEREQRFFSFLQENQMCLTSTTCKDMTIGLTDKWKMYDTANGECLCNKAGAAADENCRLRGNDDGCGGNLGEDMGDCDRDSDCAGNLVCGTDNCSWGDGDDCCMTPSSYSNWFWDLFAEESVGEEDEEAFVIPEGQVASPNPTILVNVVYYALSIVCVFAITHTAYKAVMKKSGDYIMITISDV